VESENPQDLKQDPTLTQVNPAPQYQSHFSKIHFNIILSSVLVILNYSDHLHWLAWILQPLKFIVVPMQGQLIWQGCIPHRILGKIKLNI
jgi:hypothetical protein